MNRLTRNENAWYVGAVMACGFIMFYSLPDVLPFLIRLTTMVATQVAVGEALKKAGAGT